MIQIFSNPKEGELNEIVRSAFERSCGLNSVSLSDYQNFNKSSVLNSAEGVNKNTLFNILVFINPAIEISALLIDLMRHHTCKVIVFGKLSAGLASFLEVEIHPVTEKMKSAAECEPAKTYHFSESVGAIVYKKTLEIHGEQSTMPLRALSRFDFTNEWNNLGFGAIKVDDSIWSISQRASIAEQAVIADLMVGDEVLSAYCGLWDFSQSSLLWLNRAVGPVDSYEWFLIEQFISQYRFGDIPAWPVICEIPHGYESAVTIRLDCDEDIGSARALGDAYQEKNIPFSLALHAEVLSDSNQHQYPKEVLQAGGAILSHTLTHAPNWGGSEEAAKYEGNESAKIIHETVGIKPRYAVSPFHHTPSYARKGLAAAGYKGCVGGIISSDPDFLMARAGRPPHSRGGFIGHTQQCMLHGDCMLEGGDALVIFKRAYDQAKFSKTFFGYLDHPFSPRYQYGWKAEEERIKAHMEFIEYIQRSSDKTIFMNQDDAMDFLYKKSSVRIREFSGQLQVDFLDTDNGSNFNICIQYGPSQYSLNANGVSL
ncbi:polysaccharide deacetylase [Polynucleobacter paneuropaeus]|nr:polysaccharide deacetylase [Polynucleobacter paneuropaeus]